MMAAAESSGRGGVRYVAAMISAAESSGRGGVREASPQ